MNNQETFLNTYRGNLEKAHSLNTIEYSWPIEELPMVYERMSKAILRGSFNKEGLAFKLTCKELGIKQTYKDINAFLFGPSPFDAM